MQILLKREKSTDKSTIGKLYLDGAYLCDTLEDIVRPAGEKVPGQTAIPAGDYPVILNMSERFKKIMPLLLNVPDFAGVRIHSGNVSEDTEGCILVGFREDGIADHIFNSRKAYEILFADLEEAVKKETLHITIEAAA